MMENRSFDQMLGYLSLTQRAAGKKPVNGLKGNEVNRYRGRDFKSHLLPRTLISSSPCHADAHVAENGNTAAQAAPGEGSRAQAAGGRALPESIEHRVRRPAPSGADAHGIRAAIAKGGQGRTSGPRHIAFLLPGA